MIGGMLTGAGLDGVFEKNTGRHIARGSHQRPGIDYV